MDQIRKAIDDIDLQIKNLVLKRMDCSYTIARKKFAAGIADVYQAEREAAIMEKLAYGVPENRKAEYLSLVGKIMETSRMYQYGLIYDWDKSVFDLVPGSELCGDFSSQVIVRLSRSNQPNAMSTILSMVGDYGFDMLRMELIKCTDDIVTFDLTILGDASQDHMRKLLFQLSKESEDFSIRSVVS